MGPRRGWKRRGENKMFFPLYTYLAATSALRFLIEAALQPSAAVDCPCNRSRQHTDVRPYKTIARMAEDRIDGAVTIYSDAVAPPIEGIFNDPCHACA